MTPTPNQPDHTAYYRQTLHDLIDRGADIARMVHDQARRQHEAATSAVPPAETNPETDSTIRFDRIARAVRRCVLMAQHLDDPRPALNTRAPSDPTLHRIAARKRILRAVEDQIQLDARHDHPRAESLNRELRERLDAPDLDDDIDSLPLETIIADIARDLRVAPHFAPSFKRRTPPEAAALDTAARATAAHATAGAHPGPHPPPRPKPPDRPAPSDFATLMKGWTP